MVFAQIVPKLRQILPLDHPCTRIQRHLAGLTIHFLQCFSFRLQFHFRKVFDDFGVALPEELCSPLVCDTTSAE
jgi:hypothetical protein